MVNNCMLCQQNYTSAVVLLQHRAFHSVNSFSLTLLSSKRFEIASLQGKEGELCVCLK